MPQASGSVIYVLNPYWLLKKLDQEEDRKKAQERWNEYSKKDSSVEERDWDRLYLPADEDDEKDELLRTPASPILWDSPHVTRRIAAQRSRFMIFGTDPLWLSRLVGKKDSHLDRIRIPGKSVNGIRQHLRDAGITESVVYPDLDGLGRELKQMWETRR